MGGGGGSTPPPQPPLEPVKGADEAVKEASAQAGRERQLRHGLISAFSRKAMGKGSSGESATAGSAAKLGN